jgi:hypothetical protein
VACTGGTLVKPTVIRIRSHYTTISSRKTTITISPITWTSWTLTSAIGNTGATILRDPVTRQGTLVFQRVVGEDAGYGAPVGLPTWCGKR